MVSVEDLDPPEEAKIKTEPMGVHTGAPPKEALAERAGARGTSADVLPEEGYGEAEGIAYAFNRAGSLFRRFSAGLHMIMAVRYYESLPRNSEVIEETSATVPGLAHSHDRAPDLYSPMAVGSDIYVLPGAAASERDGAAERSARSASIASTADDVRVIMLQQELQLNKMRAQMELQAARFEEELKRRDMQSTFDVRQARLLAQAEKQAEVAAAKLLAAQQIQDHMQNSDLASMQAIADRLDQPREPRQIKDIYSDAIVKCPIDKGKDEMLEWAMAMAAVSSGLCESASDMIARVLARDETVIAFASEPINVQADRWLARQINTSIKEDTEAGKLFHKEARQDAALCRSGVRLLDKVYKTVTKSNPLKLDMAEQKMATTIYFSGGMSLDQTKLAAALFKSDYSELGSRRSQDDLAIFKAMLKELPPMLLEPQSMVVRDLLWEMEESTMISEPLITFDKLVIKIAIMLRNVQGAAKKAAKEVNSTALTYAGAAKGKGKGKGVAKGGAPAKGKGGKGAPGKGLGGKGAMGMACAVCGKANVLTSACTCPPCVRCKFRFCPGAPGARAITGLGCVFDMPKFPEHKLVLQANGPIPKPLYEKAAREYAKWWNVPYEASATEASATELDEAAIRLEVEKGFALEGSVCEMEISSTERGIHTIVRGHPDLLALRDVMYLDAPSNTPMLPGCETIHLDDGANVMLIATKGLLKAAHARSWASNGAIASVAKGAKLSLEGEASLTMYPLCAGGAHELLQLQGHKASGARRNIVPPQLLAKSLGATVNYHSTKYGPPTYDISFPSGVEWLVLEYNDLFFAFVTVGSDTLIPRDLLRPKEAAASVGEINEAEANSAGALSCIDPKVWASRLATGVVGIKSTMKAVKGMESVKALTNADIHTIEHDKHRRGQVAKRQPTNVERDPKERIFTPGSRFVCDAFTFPGREQVSHIPTRAGAKAPTCCMIAVDDATGYVYAKTSDTHTTDDWVDFFSHVHAAEVMYNHKMLAVKLDRAPEFDCERLKRRVESEIHVRVLIGPSGEHECVARAEQLMDTTARATEAMLQRAKRNLGADPRRYQALAHKYALYLHNDRRPDKDGEPSRMQRHCGRVPDFGDKNGMVPYVFGCQVVRLRDENERTNWKGAGKRVADGVFVGIEHSSYMVYNTTTSKLTFEPFIWPLDELELSRTGMAAGAAQHDVACQIELSTVEPLVLLPPKSPTRVPTPKEPVASVDAPVGTRVKVFWQGVKGQPELDMWYEGTVVSITALANGQLRHVIKYDGWPDEHVHDLVNGGKQWIRLSAIASPSLGLEKGSAKVPVFLPGVPEPLPAPIAASAQSTDQWTTIGKAGKAVKPTGKATVVQAQPAKPPVRTTRHSIQKGDISVAELAETALERGQATPSMAQIIVEHLMGDFAPDLLQGDTVDSILERVADVPYEPIQFSSADSIDLEASGTQIEYVTEAGTKAVMDQPKGYSQVMASPDRDAWLEASRSRCPSSSARSSRRSVPRADHGEGSRRVQAQARQGGQAQVARGLAPDAAAQPVGQSDAHHEGGANADGQSSVLQKSFRGRAQRRHASALVRSGECAARGRHRRQGGHDHGIRIALPGHHIL